MVFDHGRQELAIKELGVSPTLRKRVRQGPLDLQREADLTALEVRITEAASSGMLSAVTVDECIEVAIISRELERPVTETLGRFERADDMAKSFGTQQQRIRCAYDRAWTMFFWFNDIVKFAELYRVVEARSKDSDNIYDLELLTNLWMLLHGHARESVDFEHHTEILVKRLTEVAENIETPTAALQAHAFLVRIQLTRAWVTQESIDSYFGQFSG